MKPDTTGRITTAVKTARTSAQVWSRWLWDMLDCGTESLILVGSLHPQTVNNRKT